MQENSQLCRKEISAFVKRGRWLLNSDTACRQLNGWHFVEFLNLRCVIVLVEGKTGVMREKSVPNNWNKWDCNSTILQGIFVRSMFNTFFSIAFVIAVTVA